MRSGKLLENFEELQAAAVSVLVNFRDTGLSLLLSFLKRNENHPLMESKSGNVVHPCLINGP